MPSGPVRLVPMNVGECLLGENHLLGDPYSDDRRVAFTLYSFLLDGGPGRRILVDLGPAGTSYVNWMFRRYGFFRNQPDWPDYVRQPCGNVFDWLERLGLSPGDIDHLGRCCLWKRRDRTFRVRRSWKLVNDQQPATSNHRRRT